MTSVMSTDEKSTRTPNAILAAVKAWPHWDTIGLVAAKEYHISKERFNVLLPEYQKFLTLGILHNGLGMFSAEVDLLWHSHILHTSLYGDFCTKLNGQMIPHLPQLSPKPDGKCTTCKSCEGCSIRCEQPPNGNEVNHPSHDTLEYFKAAYLAAFGEWPGPIWQLPEPDGLTV